MPALISQEEVKSLFHYDADTGVLTRFSNNKPAKSKHSCGYIVTSVRGSQYYVHRLAWLYVHGEFPFEDIDHINGIRSDNRLVNLRAVSTSENLQNKTAPHTNSVSGYLGVHKHTQTGRWNAKIHYDGKTHSLGLFEKVEDAYEAYVKAKRKYHKTCTL